MTCDTLAAPRIAPPPARTFEITPRVGFYLLASITMSFLAGSSAPTPLYPLYQQLWHFSPAIVTVIFGVYAVALLVMLLVAGRLSDHVGRRPVLIAAAIAQAFTMVVFATAQGVGMLIAARILQGIATGAAIGAVGAGMLDLDAKKGTVANAVAPAMGTALGGLIAGALVHWLPAPLHLVYAVFSVIYLAQAAAVYLMDEPGMLRPGALASLKFEWRAPRSTHGPLLAAAPLLIAGWAIAGFYFSLGPALIRREFGLDSPLASGAVGFALAGSASIAVLIWNGMHDRRMRIVGAIGLATGMGASLVALEFHATAAFFLASMIAGGGFGLGFQGGVRSVVASVAAAERAAALSVVFIVSYLALALPAVAAGVVVARTGRLFETALGVGALVIVLAALALHAATRRTR